jgi:transcriptional regulator with XRE-family HTH domain
MTDQKDKISNNIRKIREAKLLSLNDISRKVGLSHLTVKRVEETGPGRMETKP